MYKLLLILALITLGLVLGAFAIPAPAAVSASFWTAFLGLCGSVLGLSTLMLIDMCNPREDSHEVRYERVPADEDGHSVSTPVAHQAARPATEMTPTYTDQKIIAVAETSPTAGLSLFLSRSSDQQPR